MASLAVLQDELDRAEKWKDRAVQRAKDAKGEIGELIVAQSTAATLGYMRGRYPDRMMIAGASAEAVLGGVLLGVGIAGLAGKNTRYAMAAGNTAAAIATYTASEEKGRAAAAKAKTDAAKAGG